MTVPIPIVCHGCGAGALVNRLTAGLRCACGSTDIDLDLREASSGGTGWNKTLPDPLKGWSQYAGPMPGPNTRSAPEQTSPFTCPNCKGTKVDFLDGGLCRACKGTGKRTPTFSEAPEPYVKKHNYPSTQTTTPFMGRRRQADRDTAANPFNHAAPGRTLTSPEETIRRTTPGWATGDGITQPAKFPNVSPHLKGRDDRAAAEQYSDKALRERRTVGYPMHEAECPSCGHAPTHLMNDYKDDAWWHCKNCGPLINIDKNPHVNPYDPPDDFTPKPRTFRTEGRAAGQGKGRVLAMLNNVRTTNPGLSTREALDIVRYTVQNYAG